MQELGDAAASIHLDVTSPDDWKTAVELAVQKFGGLNVLVNNAGICHFGRLGGLHTRPVEPHYEDQRHWHVPDITAARNALVASAPSSIINVSSTAGFQGRAPRTAT